jgi:hypothetical protein
VTLADEKGNNDDNCTATRGETQKSGATRNGRKQKTRTGWLLGPGLSYSFSGFFSSSSSSLYVNCLHSNVNVSQLTALSSYNRVKNVFFS